MNHLYMASTLCWSYKMEDVLQIAKRFKFAGVEVWADHFWHHGSDPRQVNQIRENLGLDLTMHAASWDINITALNDGIRRQSIGEIKRSIDLASEIGANNITLHPGKMTLTTLEKSIFIDLLLESLQVLSNYAKEKGATLSLELMEAIPKEFIISPNAINRITEGFHPYLQTTFDVAHISLKQDPFQQFRQTLHINKIHISDVNEQQLHIPLGDGLLGANTLKHFLQIKDAPVVIEGFDRSVAFICLRRNLQYIEAVLIRKEEAII
ncbi:sugar phosphate isomerase/epimerase [Bacillus sp. FJAT-50079]|uniref:sugar phosphate isomerase/epimerase family protein n=1 Tax=Bacillus sp. FJAT-50079 TaxID=2833577 RepID=UPI001BCA07A6|nr:sugar phosphate isomerase/epimerase [Bacillus sp. FJAT-50079]MBS4208045.1 sugar phosphate isomerase/epimerase [Bacillus sp. FJAT-50079]